MMNIWNMVRSKTLSVLLFLTFLGLDTSAQEVFIWKAQVLDRSNEALPGVKIYTSDMHSSTSSDLEGNFEIEVTEGDSTFFMMPGFEDYSIAWQNGNYPKKVKLKAIKEDVLGTANVGGKKRSATVDKLSSSQLITINEGEFRKAACCNLSESFETTPSIDVSYADAFTGTRQIKLLGLQSPNILMTLENIPYIDGISSSQGLQEIPSTWVESMQLGKGLASVVNGYEGNAGQINIELKDPRKLKGTGDLNFFQNSMGRSEANGDYFFGLSPKINMGLLAHYSERWRKVDNNGDGFYDAPLTRNISLANKWNYYSDEHNIGSQLNFLYSNSQNSYGAISENSSIKGQKDYDKKAVEWKIGKLYDMEWKSLGVQFLFSDVNLDNSFYFKRIKANEKKAYVNLIYQTIIHNDKNIIKMGLNAFNTQTSEDYFSHQIGRFGAEKNEKDIGAFMAYSYLPNPTFTMVMELREDYNSLYGFNFTPRFHMRKKLGDVHTLKFQAGKATKLNNILTENIGLLNSSRELGIYPGYTSYYYSFEPQISWNFGLQYLATFPVGEGLFNLALDYNHTYFTQGYQYDMESPSTLIFRELPGRYNSDVFQASLDWNAPKVWTARLAYRVNQVKMDYENLSFQNLVYQYVPFQPLSKAFLNIEYDKNGWLINGTISRNGKQRVPMTIIPMDQLQDGYSPAYWTFNAQINKKLSKALEMYLGGDNLFGFVQKNPVIYLPNYSPQGDWVDATEVWGPINRNIVYLGLNVKL